jgi:hypothetical protein
MSSSPVFIGALLAANIYQGNPDRNQKLWSIVSTERCMLHMQVLFSNIWVLKRANVIFYERDMDDHHDLVDRYGISLSQMTTDMFHLSLTLPGSFLVHDLSPSL